MPLHRIVHQPAQAQQSRSGNSRRRGIEERSVFKRGIVIPRRYAVRWGVRDVVIGASFGSLQETRVAAVFIRSREAAKRPGQPARPAGIASIALVSGLLEKFAGFQVEYAFVRNRPIAAHQKPAGGEAMANRNIPKPFIV